MMRGEWKITPAHLDRTAMTYLRQSTLMQVREHGESTARQYGLAGEAARLGWPAVRIEVIDADLGLSGRTATRREGFKQLLGQVCLGEVGAVFGLGLGFGQFAAQLGQPGSEGGDHAGGGGVAGLAG